MKPYLSVIKLITFFLIIVFFGCKKDDTGNSAFEEIQFPDENALSWDYPVKPGSEKWKAFQSHDEMVEACLIPASVLSSLQTEELLLICLKHPLINDISAFNFFADGYSSFEMNSNGIREFYKRNDAPTVIYNYYNQMQLENSDFYSSYFFVFKVSVVEYILSAPSVISKYTSRQRKEVVAELVSKLNIKKSQTGNFSTNFLNSTYRALVRIIKCDAEGKLSIDDAKLAGCFNGMFTPPENVMKEVEEMVRQYL